MAESDRFQHFEVLKRPDGSLWELGRGAMGITYKAFDTNLRCDVALKVINGQYLNSETARQRFLREARSAAQLRHPNVATVFHLGNSEERFFYAMEYVEGETVERRVQREGPLRLDLALRVTRQVARALIAADKQQLVHRDIKPSNLMLVNDEDEDHLLLKVIDFGLAKSLVSAEDQSVTVTLGGFVGTPHFASPEQLEEREIDIRSDIYSLGVTLWFMLTGRAPFQGSMASVIHQHLGQPLPADVLLKLHPHVAALLEKMMAKKAADRYQSPTELKQALDDLLAELSGQTPTLAPIEGAGADPDAVTTIGFATGQLIRGRFEILGRSSIERALFKAKDLHSDRIVALRPLAFANRYDALQIEQLKREVGRLQSVHHLNLLAVYGIEAYDRGLLLLSEWVRGFSLQALLRKRHELIWEETERLIRPLAKVLDFAADQKLLSGRLNLRYLFVEVPRTTENVEDLIAVPVSSWPLFVAKVDCLNLGLLADPNLREPTQTLIDRSTKDLLPNAAQQLAFVTYELLGGVKMPSAPGGFVRFTPLANLSENGNTALRDALSTPDRYPSALDFLAELEEVQIRDRRSHYARIPANVPASSPASGVSASARGPGNSVQARDHLGSKTSPLLLKMLLGFILFFVLCAAGLLLFTNTVSKMPVTSGETAGAKQGSLSVDSQPEGATVLWNGQELGKTPLIGYRLPIGDQTVQLRLEGFQSQEIPISVREGMVSAMGTISLVHGGGQINLRSEPLGVAFEVVDPNQHLTSGVTPATLGNLSAGQYTVKLKYPGWPDYVQKLDLQPGSNENIDHAFHGVSVSLRSDPAGAAIYLGEQKLGVAPCTVNLPSEPIQLTSRFGELAPLSREITPSAGATLEFKHSYGTLSITSDQPGADVQVSGTDMHHPPLQVNLSPGRHEVLAKAEGFPDQQRIADISEGGQTTLQFDFARSAQPAIRSRAEHDSHPDAAGIPLSGEAVGSSGAIRTRSRGHQDEGPLHSHQQFQSMRDYKQARDQAMKRLDYNYDQRKDNLNRAKDYYDFQIKNSSGATKEKWKGKKDGVKEQMKELGKQKDNEKKALEQNWQ